MKRLSTLALLAVLLMLTGCDTERISKLEKQNQELLAEIKKEHAAVTVQAGAI